MKKRALARLLGLAVLGCALFVLTACGARVDTTLRVDESFAGSRTILLTVEDGDLGDYVEEGQLGLEQTIEAYRPDVLEYSLWRNEEDSATVYSFSFGFTGIDEYKGKVQQLLDLNPGYEGEAGLYFDYQAGDFKRGLYLHEDYSTHELMAWLLEGLREDDRITTGESNWFEWGDTVLEFAGTTYEGRAGRISVDEMQDNSLEYITMVTTANLDGSFGREIRFYDSYGGRAQEIDLAAYFAALVPSGASFEVVENDPDARAGYPTYAAKLENATAEEVVAFTNAMLQTENSFELALVNRGDGTGQFIIREQADASVYVTAEYHQELISVYVLYPGWAYDEEKRDQNEGYSQYVAAEPGSFDITGEVYILHPEPGMLHEEYLLWYPGFEAARLEMLATGANLEMQLYLGYTGGALHGVAAGILADALEIALPESVALAELEPGEDSPGTWFELDFGKDSAAGHMAALNEFVYAMTGEKHASEILYEENKAESTLFQKHYDFQAYVGLNALVNYMSSVTYKLDSASLHTLYEDGEKLDEGYTYTGGSSWMNLEVKAVNVVGILLAVLGVIAAAVALLFLARYMKNRPAPPAPVATVPAPAAPGGYDELAMLGEGVPPPAATPVQAQPQAAPAPVVRQPEAPQPKADEAFSEYDII